MTSLSVLAKPSLPSRWLLSEEESDLVNSLMLLSQFLAQVGLWRPIDNLRSLPLLASPAFWNRAAPKDILARLWAQRRRVPHTSALRRMVDDLVEQLTEQDVLLDENGAIELPSHDATGFALTIGRFVYQSALPFLRLSYRHAQRWEVAEVDGQPVICAVSASSKHVICTIEDLGWSRSLDLAPLLPEAPGIRMAAINLYRALQGAPRGALAIWAELGQVKLLLGQALGYLWPDHQSTHLAGRPWVGEASWCGMPCLEVRDGTHTRVRMTPPINGAGFLETPGLSESVALHPRGAWIDALTIAHLDLLWLAVASTTPIAQRCAKALSNAPMAHELDGFIEAAGAAARRLEPAAWKRSRPGTWAWRPGAHPCRPDSARAC